MIAEERHLRILDLIRARRFVKTTDLANTFGVSEETIRRDLEHLVTGGMARRIHGGAMIPQGTGLEPPYESRTNLHVAAKKKIAAFAAGLVNEGDTLIIDIGTTTLEFAKCLHDKGDLTVLTNSLPVAMELTLNRAAKIFLLGGMIRPDEMSLSGFLTEHALREFYVDKAILGAGGVSLREGITDYNVSEAQARKLMITRAKEVIVLADHSKFGVTALTSVVPLSSVHKIVTDSGIPAADLQALTGEGIEVIVTD